MSKSSSTSNPAAKRRVARLSAHVTSSQAPAKNYHTLQTPAGAVRFPNHFLRENLKASWDANSLQRVDFRLWADHVVTSSTRLTDTSFLLGFDDGAVGEFHLPSTSPYARGIDIEALPKAIWGAGEKHAVLRKLGTRYSGASGASGASGLRFSWGDLAVKDSKELSGLAAEQLGEGRAKLTPAVAQVRSALIEATHKYGMAIIDHVPCVPDQGVLLSDAVVGAVETTNFGYKFVIKSVRDPHNLAFDNIYLQHHTDFTYCRKCPDVALFHCLNNADKGGDSLWLDGFACAEELRRTDPSAFDLLTKVQVRHMDVTDKWDLQASHPTIEVDHGTGEIKRIYFNERTRDSWRAWNAAHGKDGPGVSGVEDPQTSPEFYHALKSFEKILEDTRFHINTPLQPGELVVFDNARVLHSRTAFEGARHMEGAYLEWGAFYATWRSLQPQIRGRPDVYCGNVVGAIGGGM